MLIGARLGGEPFVRFARVLGVAVTTKGHEHQGRSLNGSPLIFQYGRLPAVENCSHVPAFRPYAILKNKDSPIYRAASRFQP